MVNLLHPRYSLSFLAIIGGAYLFDYLSLQDLIAITRNKMIETDVNITWDLISQKLGINNIAENVTGIVENISQQYPNLFESMCYSQFSPSECQNYI